MKQLLAKLSLSHRVTQCPSCKKKIRFPIKKNQTLRVTCPQCKGQFDITFVNPLTAVLSGKTKFSKLPKNEKLKLLLLVASFSLLIFMIIGSLFAEPYPEKSPSAAPQSSEELPL